MVRLLLIVGLFFAAQVQAFAIGSVDVSFDEPTAENSVVNKPEGVQLDIAVLKAGDERCCTEAALVENRPSICKTDCKAVMATDALAALTAIGDHGSLYLASDAAIHSPVDLRPPIS